jgi:GMP synthase PP-ATPase subunit
MLTVSDPTLDFYPYIIHLTTSQLQSKNRKAPEGANIMPKLIGEEFIRVTSEVPGISRVVYDVAPKSPATVEWE